MHLLLQHLVELRDPQLVPAGMAPVRAVILLLQYHTHPLISRDTRHSSHLQHISAKLQ